MKFIMRIVLLAILFYFLVRWLVFGGMFLKTLQVAHKFPAKMIFLKSWIFLKKLYSWNHKISWKRYRHFFLSPSLDLHDALRPLSQILVTIIIFERTNLEGTKVFLLCYWFFHQSSHTLTKVGRFVQCSAMQCFTMQCSIMQAKLSLHSTSRTMMSTPSLQVTSSHASKRLVSLVFINHKSFWIFRKNSCWERRNHQVCPISPICAHSFIES